MSRAGTAPGQAALEDIYALTPLQRGLLFRRLYEPGGRVYRVQARLRVDGPLEPERFRAAWQGLLERHAALRTLFVWEGVAEPLQVVRPAGAVALRWAYEDWSELDAAQLAARLEEFLEGDHAQAFELGRAPLFRVSLLRTRASHICVWTHEHLILDGWCLPRLLAELLELYDAPGGAAALPEPVPFRRHIAWLAAQDLAAAQEYWRAALRGWTAPTPLPLRVERTAGVDPATGFAELRLELGREQTAALHAFARRAGVTLNTVVQGAWAQLLARFAGEDEVVFGVTVAGRAADDPDAERILGPCINTLPLRVRCAPQQPLTPWLRSLQAQNLELRQHGSLGLGEIQELLRSADGAGAQPVQLCASALVFENYPAPAQLGGGERTLAIRELELPADSPARLRSAERNDFALTLVVAPGAQLLLLLAFARSELREADAERLLAELVGALTAFAERGARGQREPLLGELPPDAAPALVAPAAAAAPRAELTLGGETLLERFAAHAARRPQALALLDGAQRLSYAELEQRSGALARALRRRLGGAGARVALLCERSADAVVGLLGVLRAGAAYVPLDPEWPRARRELALADSGARLLLVDRAGCERLAQDGAGGVDAIALDELLREAGPGTAALPASRAADLAYVIYTSGSSGRPKGVAVSHGALLDYVDGIAQTLELQAGWSYALLSSPAADLGHTSVYGSLGCGGALHVLSAEVSRDGEALLAHCAEHGPLDVIKIAPSQLTALLDAAGTALLPRRYLILGGEPTPAALQRRLAQGIREHAPGCRVINHYGPTEATVGALCEPLLDADCAAAELARAPGLGRPLPRVRAQIADRHGRGVPAGVAGELQLGGPGLALGYLGRPALTAERFAPDPAGAAPGARLYRSGDRVRQAPDGRVLFLGRTDRQLGLRGQRIEPGEIEAALRAVPGVRDACVQQLPVDGEPRLIAYWLAAGTQPLAAESLRAQLEAVLPAGWVPARFVCLPAWPLLGSGKLDVRALPAPGAAAREPGEPRSDAERILAAIWADVLGCERVGIRENFFELGGDSIRSLQVVARARRAGLRFTPKALFEARTVERLAELAERAPAAPAIGVPAAPASGAPAAPADTGAAPLTPIQQRFFESAHPAPNHWNQALLLRAPADTDAQRLAAALTELARCHAALRLRFARAADGRWTQRAEPAAGAVPALARVELAGLSEAQARAALETRAEQAQRELDLERGPVFAALWFDAGAGREGRLLLLAHHLVIDAVSWRILLADLAALWRGEALPADTTSFLAWAQAHAVRGAELRAELPYWLAAPAPALPRDFAPSGPSAEGAALGVERTLDAQRTRALLVQAARVYRAELDDLLLAALGAALRQVWGVERVAIECEAHGRDELAGDLDLSRCVGWFTARYPLQLELSSIEEARAGLRSVQQQRRAVPGRGLGWGLLRYGADADAAQALRALPQPELCFNNLGHLDAIERPGEPFARAPESPGPLRDPRSPRAQPLELTAWTAAGELQLRWTYDPGVHRAQTLERLADAALTELAAWAERAQAETRGWLPAWALPLAGLSDAELASLELDGRQIEDVYRCAPLQEGLLVQSLRQRSAYVNQWSAQLHGLDAAALCAAWSELAQRHAVLRTALFWEGRAGGALRWPVQVVYRHCELPLRELDWRELSEAEQEQRWRAELAADRERGYALERAPLWRLLLARCGERHWRVLWSRHHVLLDGWSSARVVSELLRLYAAGVGEEHARLEPVIPYREYIRWVWSRSAAQAELLWQAELASWTGPTPLPLDAAQGEAPAGVGEVSGVLSGAPWAGICALARAADVTPNTLCQAAWGLLLARASGERRVWFGTTEAGRSAELADAERMVGLLIQTLPLCVSCAPEQRVGAWLAELQSRAAAQRERAVVPLGRLQALAPRGAGGSGELFESLFVYENYPLDEALRGADALLGVSEAHGSEPTHYALTLVLTPGAGELRAVLQYARDRYSAAGAQRVLQLYRELLLRLARRGADACLGDVGLLDTPRAAAPWAPVAAAGAEAGGTLVTAFRRAAARWAERTALSSGAKSLTYAELESRSSALGRGLRQRGVRAQSRVGLRLEPSLERVVALLGILKSGGCYVPIEPEQPAARQQQVVRDAGVRWVLGSAGGAELGADVAVLEPAELEAAGEDYTAAEPELSRGQLAYVIYTSGSTGTPKGVGVTHGQVLRLLESSEREFGFAAGDVWSQFFSSAFDVSVWELWGALLYGGRAVEVPRAVRRDAGAFLELLRAEGVTVLNQTPSAFMALCEPWLGAPAQRRPRSLRLVIFAGEALEQERLGRWFAEHGSVGPRLVNMYGTTETTVHVTVSDVVDATASSAGSAIGEPLSDLSVQVLDAAGNAAADGVWGELWLGGAGVSLGYLGRPGLTAERFVPDRWGPPGSRAYCSGDLGRRAAGGGLEYGGRRDRQVKLRGYRIELGEIESALRAHAAVRAAVVRLQRGAGGAGEARLVAFVVPVSETPAAGAAELREHVRARLPEYMVPALVVTLSALPLTANGKLDERALAELAAHAGTSEAGSGEPRDELERRLVQLWAGVLSVERVGVHDDFFALGGHSLLVVQIRARLRAALDVDVPIEELFAVSTVAELAAAVRRLAPQWCEPA